MKLWVIAALALLTLAGCTKKAEETMAPGGAPQGRGRFVGVGIYAPSRLWEQLAAEPAADGARPAPTDPAAATLKNDSEIIVVLDSSTGQLRQCGNLSGVCISMRPWAKAGPAPARLLKHEADLQREAEAAEAQEDAAADKAGRARINVRVKEPR